MKPEEIIAWLREHNVARPAQVLRHLANSVLDAQLASGARVLDATDFKQWLGELSNEADREMA